MIGLDKRRYLQPRCLLHLRYPISSVRLCFSRKVSPITICSDFFPLQISLFVFIAELRLERFETCLFGRSILNPRASVSSHFQTSRNGLKENKGTREPISFLPYGHKWSPPPTRGGWVGVGASTEWLCAFITIINTFRSLFKASDTFDDFQVLIKMADSHRNCQHH